MFYVINGIRLKPGVREEFVRLLEPNARGASKEPGCISFNVIQDNANPDVLWFIEAFKQKKDSNGKPIGWIYEGTKVRGKFLEENKTSI